jgi:hypothetical protein
MTEEFVSLAAVIAFVGLVSANGFAFAPPSSDRGKTPRGSAWFVQGKEAAQGLLKQRCSVQHQEERRPQAAGPRQAALP